MYVIIVTEKQNNNGCIVCFKGYKGCWSKGLLLRGSWAKQWYQFTSEVVLSGQKQYWD